MQKVTSAPTFQSALNEAYGLSKAGWRVVHSDRPEIGEVGFLAKKVYNDFPIERRVVWYPFGLLRPETKVASSEDDFLNLFQSHLFHRTLKCDDPETDLLGFVCYCKQKLRLSTVFQVPIELAKNLGPVFLGAREAAEKDNLRALLVDA